MKKRKEYNLQCEECGRPFTSFAVNAKGCSIDCRKKRKKKVSQGKPYRTKEYQREQRRKNGTILDYWIVYCLPNETSESPEGSVGSTNQPRLRMPEHERKGNNTEGWFELERHYSEKKARDRELLFQQAGRFAGERKQTIGNLTDMEAILIRIKKFKSKISDQELSEKFNVGRRAINHIVNGKYYKHIPLVKTRADLEDVRRYIDYIHANNFIKLTKEIIKERDYGQKKSDT